MPIGELVLDARTLEPPEPYERAVATLENLDTGQFLHMISRLRPRLLYPWLQQHGFLEQTMERAPDLYEIYVWRSDDHDTGTLIETLK